MLPLQDIVALQWLKAIPVGGVPGANLSQGWRFLMTWDKSPVVYALLRTRIAA